MAFHWRADDGPLLVLFGSSFPLSKNKQKKKNIVRVGPPLAKISECAHGNGSLQSYLPCWCTGAWLPWLLQLDGGGVPC